MCYQDLPKPNATHWLEVCQSSSRLKFDIFKLRFTFKFNYVLSYNFTVPLKPRDFRVREKASTYFLLQWDRPAEVYGTVKGYKVSIKGYI